MRVPIASPSQASRFLHAFLFAALLRARSRTAEMRLVVWCDVPPGECVMDLSEEELRTWTLRTLCRK
jgi:hypothetical protein